MEAPILVYSWFMIDSHCHLADKQFNRDLDEVLLRAEEHGVEGMVTIADTLKESQKCLELAEKYPQIFCTVGVHPHHAKHWQNSDLDRIRSMVASSPKVKAIGEIGLDYHYDNSPRDVQCEVFRVQLKLAKELDLPTVVHCRNAIEDIKKIICEVKPRKLVLHCCTEVWDDVEDLVNDGYLLGFTGIATYPQAEDIRTVIKNCPIEQMMIETDSPYLAPIPHRGKRNEPAYVRQVAILVCKLKGIPLEEVDRVTTKNTLDFYGI